MVQRLIDTERRDEAFGWLLARSGNFGRTHLRNKAERQVADVGVCDTGDGVVFAVLTREDQGSSGEVTLLDESGTFLPYAWKKPWDGAEIAPFYLVEEPTEEGMDACSQEFLLRHLDAGDVRSDGPLLVAGRVRRPAAIERVNPNFTSKKARKVKKSGVIVTQLVIDETGKVVDVELVQGIHEAMDQEALDAAWKSTFEPATLLGRPVAVYYRLIVRFHRG